MTIGMMVPLNFKVFPKEEDNTVNINTKLSACMYTFPQMNAKSLLILVYPTLFQTFQYNVENRQQLHL